jgi:hypothetical protein
MDDKKDDEEMEDIMDENDPGDDDMFEETPTPAPASAPKAPTPSEIKAALTAVVEDAKKRTLAVRAYSENEVRMIDMALSIFNSDAAVGMAAASGKPLVEIVEAMKKELLDVEKTFEALSPPAPQAKAAPPTPALKKTGQAGKKGFFEDTSEKIEAPAAPEGPACEVCKAPATTTPLMLAGTKYYCVAHVKEAGVAPPPGMAPPPAKIPWHIHTLAPFDAIRKRIAGSNTLLQIIAGEGEDTVQMTPGDRIVVMLMKPDGKKHKVFDKAMATSQLYLFEFKLSSWGPSTLSPGQSRGMTPMGYI